MTDMSKMILIDEDTVKLALETLELFITPNWAGAGVDKANEAHAALREALASEAKEQPAQRTWVNATTWRGLTDEQMRKVHHEDQFGLFCDYDEFEQIARAIEAAHGIKGDA